MNETARHIIAALGLEPLAQEGGFFRRVHTFYDEARAVTGSMILYLMTSDDFSALHRLMSDEVWTFLEGSDIEQLTVDPEGRCMISRLGKASEGKTPTSTVKAGYWQAARPVDDGRWSLCAATMVPPWDEESFCLADQALLDRLGKRDECRRFIKERR